MDNTLRKGNLVILKRPLADFLCIVNWIDGDDISIRYLDSPHSQGYSVVKRNDVIKLEEEQEKELPNEFLEAIERQRQVVFSPKQSKQSLATLLRGVSADKEDQIFRILLEDGQDTV